MDYLPRVQGWYLVPLLLSCSVDMSHTQSILQDRLGMVLMSPCLTAYVTGLSDKVIVSHVTKNFSFHRPTDYRQIMVQEQPSVFKMPPELYEDATLPKKLASLIRNILVQLRSQIKCKVCIHQSHYHNVYCFQ